MVIITDDILIWFFPSFISAGLGILFLFFIERQLAIAVSFLFFGYILITIYKTNPIVKTQEKLSESFEKVFGNLYDSFSNVQTIKSCAGEKFQEEKNAKDFRGDLSPVYKKFTALWHSLHLWQNLFFSTGFVAVFAFALLLLENGAITAGKLVMFLGYLNLVYAPLTGLAWYWQQFRTGMAKIKRAEKFLEIPEEDFNEKGIILEEIKGKVEFQNVSFGYADNPTGQLVLDKIAFSALPGQKIALVGGSGEGKTTLADLISNYFKPVSGKILLDNVDIQNLNLYFLRKIIAYVPQEITLFNDTVKNNIRYGKPEANDEEIIKAAKTANAHGFIESFPKKYETLVGERGVKLSTGQKQRIAIARALIREPKLLILDEATSSLDSESEKLVQEALEKLIKNRTTFIIAHRLSTIRKADKILVLEKGKIVEEGNHEDLMKKKGVYHKFYSLQFPIDL
ncbi:MAG: ABC transporter ATP-binding protein [Patescibacteria group bacterium]